MFNQFVRLIDSASLAFKFTICCGKLGFAGWLIFIVAGLSNDAKRKYIGLSPWPAQTSGATNQNEVSIWAFVFKAEIKNVNIKNKKYLVKKI